MLPDHQYDAIRFEEFCTSVLKPLAFPSTVPLAIETSAWPSRVSLDEATQGLRARPEVASLGVRWGPLWSTRWFRLSGSIPAAWHGQRVVLRFSSGTEATLWRDGRPFAGFDPYHDLAPVSPAIWSDGARAVGGASVEMLIEAACNLPLGATTFWWDQPEMQARWREESPGRLDRAELCTLDERAWQFAERFDALRRLLWTLPASTARSNELRSGLRAIVNEIPALPPGVAREALDAQWDALHGLGKGVAVAVGADGLRCTAIGHAHIDTAWLWRIDESRRQCARTFSTALRNMERFPSFTFLCSQAQQYAFIEEEHPALFEEIRAAVSSGRWEPNGAMWIEPDCASPSGESFIRQLEHGTRYWRERFGDAAPQRFLYLPDTFGFPACLPQLCRLAGLDTFITNKIAWNDTNRFPHVNFLWRGLDGTDVLTHLTPGHNYNSELDSRDIIAGAGIIESLDEGRVREWLQPFGWGDGGGGPDPSQIERANMFAECAGVPRTAFGRADSLCDRLHARADELSHSATPLPVWDGDLYLEAHRGTFTSQRCVKQANRKAERLLRRVEILAVMTGLRGEVLGALLGELDGLWKTTLLHQFHDILPGSSIQQVYDDARQEMGKVLERLDVLEIDGLRRVRRLLDVRDGEHVVFNSASVADEAEGLADDGLPVPPCAVSPVTTAVGVEPVRVDVALRTIDNGIVRIELDEAGRVRSLENHLTESAVGALSAVDAGPLNQLMLFEDRPRRWEAWDTDRDYRDKPTPIQDHVPCELVDSEACSRDGAPPGTLGLSVRRSIGQGSTIEQRYELSPNESMVRIRTNVNWQEERTLLRVEFPTGIRARSARVGTQFGFLEHATHRNTSWDRARFEFPGHDWMEISEDGVGLAVLDDGIVGRSIDGGTLGLSLLKSSNFPDPKADRGEHRFTYALMVTDGRAHLGPERLGSAIAHADRLNNPLCVGIVSGGPGSEVAGSTCPRLLAPIRVQLSGSPHDDLDHPYEIAALKPTQDGSGDVILRLVERYGSRPEHRIAFGFAAARVAVCDLHESPQLDLDLDDNGVEVSLAPFEVLSLRVTRA